jgi:inner membrane protein involved in colicin E2 resistance
METAATIVPPPGLHPARGRAATMKLLLIGLLVLVLQIPVHLIHELEKERKTTREHVVPKPAWGAVEHQGAFEAYRVIERAMNYDALVVALVLTGFFLFETLAGLRLHVVHYGLVGAALCLFYLGLLALGEFVGPDLAYLGAAVASSLLIVLYSAAILRSQVRAGVIGALLAGVYGILYVVLRQENYALLAGTGALFAALGAVMFFTRNVDWDSDAPGPQPAA